jgi:Holliday junction DNA helicase RuvA
MIGYLEGTVRGKVLLTPSGVGYLVQTPRPLPEQETVRLHVTTVVREESITLYGFVEEAEQMLFDALCRVTGVGASSALSVIRDAGVAAVVAAFQAKDPARLGRVRGVGAKTAARIISDLKMPDGLESSNIELTVDEELVSTLVALGFDRAASMEAIALVPGGEEDDVIAAALTHLRAGNR